MSLYTATRRLALQSVLSALRIVDGQLKKIRILKQILETSSRRLFCVLNDQANYLAVG